jgi:hypothetical protein
VSSSRLFRAPADDPVAALAQYFTGSDVARHSLALGVGNPEAKRFFAARDALGIRGYVGTAEAEAAIRATLGRAFGHHHHHHHHR